MAEATQTATDPNGNVFEFVNGDWRPQRAQPSTGEAIAIGAGKTFESVIEGAKDLGLAAIEQLPFAPDVSGARQNIAQKMQSNAPFFDELSQQQPIATGVGQALPFLAAAPLAGASIPAQAALGAVEGGIQFGTPQQRLTNSLIGGGLAAGGAGALNLVQRVSQGISGSARNIAQRRTESFGGADSAGAVRVEDSVVGTGSQSRNRSFLQNAGSDVEGVGAQSAEGLANLKRGVELGIMFKPGAQSGNIAGKQFFASASSSPLLSDIVQRTITTKNNQTLSKLTLRALGQKGNEFTDATLTNIETGLSRTRDTIAKNNPVIKVDNTFTKKIDDITSGFETNPAILSEVDPVMRNIEKFKSIVTKGDSITSGQYMKLRKQMRSLQRKFKDDAEAQAAIGDTIDAFDGLFSRSVSAADKKAFDKTTQQFRLLQALEKPGVIGNDKIIRPGALGRNFSKIFKTEFTRGDKFETLKDLPEFKDLFDATKVFNHFPDVVGDSGTATRSSLKNILGDKLGTAATLAARPLFQKIIESAQPKF